VNSIACAQLVAVLVIAASGLANVSRAVGTVPADLFQGGALVVLSWTVYHMLTKTIPGHLRALEKQAAVHEESQRLQRKDFLQALQQTTSSK